MKRCCCLLHPFSRHGESIRASLFRKLGCHACDLLNLSDKDAMLPSLLCDGLSRGLTINLLDVRILKPPNQRLLCSSQHLVGTDCPHRNVRICGRSIEIVLLRANGPAFATNLLRNVECAIQFFLNLRHQSLLNQEVIRGFRGFLLTPVLQRHQSGALPQISGSLVLRCLSANTSKNSVLIIRRLLLPQLTSRLQRIITATHLRHAFLAQPGSSQQIVLLTQHVRSVQRRRQLTATEHSDGQHNRPQLPGILVVLLKLGERLANRAPIHSLYACHIQHGISSHSQ